MILERKKGILIVDWHYGRHLSRVFYHNVSFSNKWILFVTIFYFLSDNQAKHSLNTFNHCTKMILEFKDSLSKFVLISVSW